MNNTKQIILASIGVLGTFFSILTTNANVYMVAHHLGGLAWLLYPAAWLILVFTIVNVYKPNFRHLHTWLITLSLISIVDIVWCLISAYKILYHLAQEYAQATDVVVYPGSGSFMIVLAHGAIAAGIIFKNKKQKA